MAEFDLTKIYCQFLDRHLTFPLLEFLCGKEIYNRKELLEFVLETVNKTNMIDYIMDTRLRLNLGKEMPEDLAQRKVEVLATLKELKRKVAPIMLATDKLKQGDSLKDSKTFVSALKKNYNFQAEELESAYKLAKYFYECGNYQESTSYLYFCSIVMTPDNENYLNVLWGKLASEILTLNWSAAMEDLMRLREYIDSADFSMVQAWQQRAWLIHWSVLVFFHHPKGRDLLIDLFLFTPLYLNAIETICPHILRYLATAVILNRARRNALRDMIRVIQQEAHSYRDPITEFLERIYVSFDFEGARLKLRECEIVFSNDFLIVGWWNEFVENARLMIFETVCRTHRSISISMLADKLNMNPDEAECWIVNLICKARLNAKVDSKLGHVVMNMEAPNAYQQLREKIDSLSERVEHLTDLVEKKSQQKTQSVENWKYF